MSQVRGRMRMGLLVLPFAIDSFVFCYSSGFRSAVGGGSDGDVGEEEEGED
jgi:hypothetical protein